MSASRALRWKRSAVHCRSSRATHHAFVQLIHCKRQESLEHSRIFLKIFFDSLKSVVVGLPRQHAHAQGAVHMRATC